MVSDEQRQWKKRRFDWGNYLSKVLPVNITAATVVIAGLSGTMQAFGWDLPVPTTKAFNSEKTATAERFAQVDKRLDNIESQLGELSTSMLLGRELQLQSELRNLETQLVGAKAGTGLYAMLAGQRDTVSQQLRTVQSEIRQRQRAAGAPR